jgi:hypothetical protein
MPVAVAAVVPVVVAAAIVVRVVSGREYEFLYDFSVTALAFGPLGLLIVRRVRGHGIGRLFLGLAAGWALGVLCGSLAVALGAGILAALSESLRIAAFGGLGLVVLWVPTGKPPSKRWRPVGWTLCAGIVVGSVAPLIAKGPVEDIRSLTNPIGLVEAHPLVDIGFILVLAGVLGAIASIIVRFRSSRGEERQQLKLFTLVAAMSVVLIVAFNIALPYQMEHTALGSFVWDSPIVLLPAAIGFAILRHGLYDIDRVISRTLSYATLTALIAGIYAILVLGLGALLRPVFGSSDVVVALATLFVAAIFRRLGRRVQDAVDRRFYRSRYDAVHIIDSFASRLREEVDLDALATELTTVVRQAIHPRSVSVWLRAPTPR